MSNDNKGQAMPDGGYAVLVIYTDEPGESEIFCFGDYDSASDYMQRLWKAWYEEALVEGYGLEEGDCRCMEDSAVIAWDNDTSTYFHVIPLQDPDERRTAFEKISAPQWPWRGKWDGKGELSYLVYNTCRRRSRFDRAHSAIAGCFPSLEKAVGWIGRTYRDRSCIVIDEIESGSKRLRTYSFDGTLLNDR